MAALEKFPFSKMQFWRTFLQYFDINSFGECNCQLPVLRGQISDLDLGQIVWRSQSIAILFPAGISYFKFGDFKSRSGRDLIFHLATARTLILSYVSCESCRSGIFALEKQIHEQNTDTRTFRQINDKLCLYRRPEGKQ